jgi:hypothetical protein
MSATCFWSHTSRAKTVVWVVQKLRCFESVLGMSAQSLERVQRKLRIRQYQRLSQLLDHAVVEENTQNIP